MTFLRSSHRSHFQYFANRELDEFYASVVLRSFAIAMIGVFVPIYFLVEGYSLREVLLFFVIMSVTHLVLLPFSARLTSKRGCKHAMLYSMPFLVGFFYVLNLLETQHLSLAIPAVILGINQALYWMGYHVDFARFSDKKHRGRELSVVQIMTALANVGGPLLGGFLATIYGWHVLFILAVVFLVASTIPLFQSDDYREAGTYALRDVFSGRSRLFSVKLFARGLETGVDGVLWPIFIYGILKSFASLGFATSLGFLSSMLVVYVVGRLADHHREALLRGGAIVGAVLWMVRPFVRTSTQVFSIDAAHGAVDTTVEIPFTASNYDQAKRGHVIPLILHREFVLLAGRVFIYSLAIVLPSLPYAFPIAALASLTHIF
jgi:hypothetical protein